MWKWSFPMYFSRETGLARAIRAWLIVRVWNMAWYRGTVCNQHGTAIHFCWRDMASITIITLAVRTQLSVHMLASAFHRNASSPGRCSIPSDVTGIEVQAMTQEPWLLVGVGRFTRRRLAETRGLITLPSDLTHEAIFASAEWTLAGGVWDVALSFLAIHVSQNAVMELWISCQDQECETSSILKS